MEEEKIVIDQDYVKEKFAEKIHPEDIDRYIPVAIYLRKLLMYCIASGGFPKREFPRLSNAEK